MKCESAAELAGLYLYGELEPRQEDEFEQHLHECARCREDLERRRALHGAIERSRVVADAALLSRCRSELSAALPAGRPAAPTQWWRQTIAAVGLIALGFFGSRLTPGESAPPVVRSAVRSVSYDESGRVQVALEETRRRLVSGSLDDARIQSLMLAAARDTTNDGLRVESIEMLKQRAGSSEVRNALLSALRNDPNPGVRFKALDGLKSMAAEPEVREALSYVLQNDQNPGVRIQAIELLTQKQDPEIIGMLQRVVTRESNNYVRQRCERALQEWNASVGTF
jgi:anti-sigma factor RsiW